MYKKVLLSGLALTLAAPTFAAVTLNLTDQVDLILVNGEKPELEGGFFSSEKYTTLPDGENQIVFRYQPTFKNGKDRDEFSSQVIVAKFTAEDADLRFKFPQYRNLREAETKFDKESNWQLLDSLEQPVPFVQDKLIHNGMQIGRDYPQEMITYNVEGGVAAVALTGNAAAIAAAQQAQKNTSGVTQPALKETSAPVQNVDSNTAEEMLHFWYSKADAETQARFKEYVNSQK